MDVRQTAREILTQTSQVDAGVDQGITSASICVFCVK